MNNGADVSDHHPDEEAHDVVYELNGEHGAGLGAESGSGVVETSSPLDIPNGRKNSQKDVNYNNKVVLGSGFRSRELESNIPGSVQEIDEMREFSQGSGALVDNGA